MTPKAYLAISIFSSVFTLSACQTALQSVTANQQAPIVAPVVPAILDSDGDGVLDDIDECPEMPNHTIVDVKGCEIIVEGGEALEMELQGFFAPLSSQLINSYDKEFVKIEEKLNEHLDAKVYIFGHMSSNELEIMHNKNNLSRNRAINVKNRLVERHHIASDRISTYDCSDRYPFIDTDFRKSDFENMESKDRRVSVKASTQVDDLANLEAASDRENYEKYSKRCEIFE